MTNETKQTAVEWHHIELSKFLHGKSEYTDAHDILIKAKEMEKEQTLKFGIQCQLDFIKSDGIRSVDDIYERNIRR